MFFPIYRRINIKAKYFTFSENKVHWVSIRDASGLKHKNTLPKQIHN